jgi:hypothetical protein
MKLIDMRSKKWCATRVTSVSLCLKRAAIPHAASCSRRISAQRATSLMIERRETIIIATSAAFAELKTKAATITCIVTHAPHVFPF